MTERKLTEVWSGPSLRVANALARAGVEVRVVGGAVRDALSGREAKDVDLVADAPFDRLQKIVRVAGLRSAGATEAAVRNGLVRVLANGEAVEVVAVRHGGFGPDAASRDFTINAMSVDRAGVLYDPHGGAEDLRHGLIRFNGSAADRIAEDPLRLLRFFRFRGRFGAASPVPDAVGELAPLLQEVSVERVWSEMSALLQAPEGRSQMDSLAAAGLLVHGLRLDTVCLREMVGVVPRGIALGLAWGSDGAGLLATLERLRCSRSVQATARFAFENRCAISSALGARKLAFGTPAVSNAALLVSAMLRARGDIDGADVIDAGIEPFPLDGTDMLALGYENADIGKAINRLRALWADGDFQAKRDELLVVASQEARVRPSPS